MALGSSAGGSPPRAWNRVHRGPGPGAGRSPDLAQGSRHELHAQHGPASAELPAALARPAVQQPVKKGAEDRAWLMGLGVFFLAALIFGAMVLLTALGGGDGYVPWSG